MSGSSTGSGGSVATRGMRPLSTLSTAELREHAARVARAFRLDPLFQWLEPDSGRRSAMLDALFGWSLTNGSPDRLVGSLDHATAIWSPPAITPVSGSAPAEPPGALAGIMARLAALPSHRPTGPHWYLHIVAVDESGRGAGVGARLVRPVLQDAATGRTPVWLTTTNPRNHAFYRRLGFRVAAVDPVAHDVHLTSMVHDGGADAPYAPAPSDDAGLRAP